MASTAEQRASSSCSPRGRSAVSGLRQALGDVVADPACVVVAGAGARGAHRARLVVHVVFHGADGGLALARARVQPAVGFVQIRGSQEGLGLFFGERQRALGHAQRIGQGVGGQRALRGARPVLGRGHLLLPEVVVPGHGRGVFTHAGQPTRGQRVQLVPFAIAQARIRHLAHQRVLEHPLARAREARQVLLHQDLGPGQRLHHALGVPDPQRLEPRIPAGLAEHAQPAHRVAALVVQRVQAHLNGGLDGGGR
jgi:hypothetical protein